MNTRIRKPKLIARLIRRARPPSRKPATPADGIKVLNRRIELVVSMLDKLTMIYLGVGIFQAVYDGHITSLRAIGSLAGAAIAFSVAY